MTNLKKTPIYPVYKQYGAKTIDFGGWELPVQFSGIKYEHKVTRTKATIFDVSHMGQIIVRGNKSLPFLQRMLTNDVSKLQTNRVQYTFMCYEDGGTVDDFLVYKLKDHKYLLVVNAANTKKDYQWLTQNNEYADGVIIEDVSDQYGVIALQGPKAKNVLQKITDTDIDNISPFSFDANVDLQDLDTTVIISRTGYTGEDGFELYVPAEQAINVWNLLLTSGEEEGVEPAGLGARDTLRFEASLPLYGNELSEEITPIEAGLHFAVKTDKNIAFIGQEVLKEQIENGPKRKLVGIEMIERGIPRKGYDVLKNNEKIGVVTSGTQAPTLNKNLGLGLIQAEHAMEGTELVVQVRRRQVKAKIVQTPFLNK